MPGDTVTRAQLTEAVYQEVGLSRNESADLVESILDEISDALIREEMVKISSFGSFFVRQKGQRVGRNPKTGEEVPILPRRVLVFRPSHVLKNRINDGYQSRDQGVAPVQPQQPAPAAAPTPTYGGGFGDSPSGTPGAAPGGGFGQPEPTRDDDDDNGGQSGGGQGGGFGGSSY